MQVVVDSLLTHYEQTGSAKPVIVLLHGWGDNLKTFTGLQKALSAKATIISLDLPGFGDTQAPAKVWGLDEYAQFIATFLQKIGIKKVQTIVAHSNGGALAIRGVSSGILSCEKLVLLSSAGIRNRQRGKKVALKVIAKTGKVMTFWLPTQHKRRLQKLLYGAAGSDMLVAPHLQETFKKTVAQDVQADAAKLQVPTLLIYGEKDRATPTLYGKLFHNLIDGSTLEIITGAGHFVHHDASAQVLQAIEGFVN